MSKTEFEVTNLKIHFLPNDRSYIASNSFRSVRIHGILHFCVCRTRSCAHAIAIQMKQKSSILAVI